jgi:thiol-disulfide isomerase/thioredoxin
MGKLVIFVLIIAAALFYFIFWGDLSSIPVLGKKVDKLDVGYVEDSTYKNKYFGMEMKIPSSWTVHDKKSVRKLINESELIEEDVKKNIQLPVLSISKYYKALKGKPNPTLELRVHKIPEKDKSRLKRGKDCLDEIRKAFYLIRKYKMVFSDKTYTTKIDGKVFDIMTARVQLPGGIVVRVKCYITVMKGYALMVSLFYVTKKGQIELQKILKGAKFDCSIPEKVAETSSKTSDKANYSAPTLANSLIKRDGSRYDGKYLKNKKYIIYYFSAGYCGECHNFTPELIKFYKANYRRANNFQIIFVSTDRSEEEMMAYMNAYKMPWPAIRFDRRAMFQTNPSPYIPCLAFCIGKYVLYDGKIGNEFKHPKYTLKKIKKAIYRR